MDAIDNFTVKKYSLLLASFCFLPILFNLVGVDFGSASYPVTKDFLINATKSDFTNSMFYGLRGAFEHTLLEWSALWAAAFTACLALSHFRIAKDITTPIIGIALFFSGCMDAFHTLAADRLIESVANNQELIPFTWAICRLFNSLIMILGVGLFAYGKNFQAKLKPSVTTILLTSLCFGIIAYAIIHYCATSENLPQTMYSGGFFGWGLITRPFDVLPLLIYIIAGVWVYPKFYRRYPSLFSAALIISIIPEIATQLYMAFGSTKLFDNAFNIAHFLKVFAYLVPFVGLIMDYIFTYQKEQYAREQAEQFSTAAIIAKKEAEAATALAQSANMAKTDFLNMISHELRTPLTVVIGNLQELSDDNELTEMLPVKIDERRLDHHLNDNSSLKNILNNETERHSLKDIIIDIASVDTSEVVDIAGDAHRYANHLLILINDVLDFSKIQAGKMSIICEPIYAIEIVDHVFESISSLAKQKN